MIATVRRGREELALELDDAATVSTLKQALARRLSIRADTIRLMAKGKTLGDADLVPACKIMLMQCAAPHNASRTVTLRCLSTGRARDVQVAASISVADLTDRATTELGLSGQRALYLEQGQQLLRPDLTMSDYAIGSGCEIFVCPAPPTAQPPTEGEDGAASQPKAKLPSQLPPPQLLALPASLAEMFGPEAVGKASQCSDCSDVGAKATEDARGAAAVAPAQIRSGLLPSSGGGGGGPSLGSSMMQVPLEMLLEGMGALSDGAESQREIHEQQRLEGVCAKLVHDLQRGPPAAEAEAPHDARQREKEWGKGLSKGFLSRPKKRRKAVRPPAPPTETLEAPSVPAKPTRKATAGACCATCAVRLPAMTASLQARCRCGELFCARHMHAHACKHDYKAAQALHLRDANPKVEPPKLEAL